MIVVIGDNLLYARKVCYSINMTSIQKKYRTIFKKSTRNLKLVVLILILWGIISYTGLYFYLAKSKPEGIYDQVAKAKLYKLLENNVPNLPERYFGNPDDLRFDDDHDPCEKYPSLQDLAFNNHFQEMYMEDGTSYLYSAHYDDRPLTGNSEHAMVRILGFINKPEVKVRYYCQLWFKDTSDHALVYMTSIERLDKELIGEDDIASYSLIPYMFSCPVPKKYKLMVPDSVSILEKPCQNLTNNIQIESAEASTKDNFCVCKLGLEVSDFPDIFDRFIEWMNMLEILGVEKVLLYEEDIDSTIYPMLYYYINTGFLELIEFKLPDNTGKSSKAVHVNYLTYNDCLYKNIYSYNYITTLGLNEIIIPKRSLTTWKEVLNLVKADFRLSKNSVPSSFIFSNAYFTDTMKSKHETNDKIPSYLIMQQNAYRSTRFSPEQAYIGSIHDTSRAEVLGMQRIAKCIDTNCYNGYVVPREGLMHRYQKDMSKCVGETANSCAVYEMNTTLDTSIHKYLEGVDIVYKHAVQFVGFKG
ncbi:unnamed protein product [Meganyctiphanes norvegica]|uniref:Glycosyltransferase family 92 protein n=1 Tax=Meganyctiphanes norvegica TaxID=48144 RepID=A0AAV2S302_MEGNR